MTTDPFAPGPPPTDPMKQGVWQILTDIHAGHTTGGDRHLVDAPPPPDLHVTSDEAARLQTRADDWTEREAS